MTVKKEDAVTVVRKENLSEEHSRKVRPTGVEDAGSGAHEIDASRARRTEGLRSIH